MNTLSNASRHTLKNDPCGPTDTNAPSDQSSEWSEVEPASNANEAPVPIVPQMTQGSFSEVRRALFGTSNPAIEPEPVSATGGGAEKHLSAAGGGEEPAASDDGDSWIIDPEAAAMLDDLEEVDFDDVPVCSCGRYCDVQTLSDDWHCSHCDPAAEERRKRTSRLLSQVERIRRENGLSD